MNVMFCGQSRPSGELSRPIGRHCRGRHLTASYTHCARLQAVTIVSPYGRIMPPLAAMVWRRGLPSHPTAGTPTAHHPRRRDTVITFPCMWRAPRAMREVMYQPHSARHSGRLGAVTHDSALRAVSLRDDVLSCERNGGAPRTL